MNRELIVTVESALLMIKLLLANNANTAWFKGKITEIVAKLRKKIQGKTRAVTEKTKISCGNIKTINQRMFQKTNPKNASRKLRLNPRVSASIFSVSKSTFISLMLSDLKIGTSRPFYLQYAPPKFLLEIKTRFLHIRLTWMLDRFFIDKPRVVS